MSASTRLGPTTTRAACTAATSASTEAQLSRPASPALAGLLGPAEAERLLNDGFGREAWRARIGPSGARELFDWPALNAALASHRLTPPRIRLERGGVRVGSGLWRARSGQTDLEVAGVLAELRDGATLIIDAAHEFSPPLQRLCAGLSADFTAFCAANLYASWGTTQGFDVHWDDHDVLVVQAEGRKRWALYGRTRASPVVRADPPEHIAPGQPLSEILLEPGDILYLPRGYWHAAVGIGEPSLHLTVGLTRRTGSEFLHWLADHLLSEAAVRTDLPFEQGDAVVGESLRALIAGLSMHDTEALARLYRRHVESSLPQRPKLSFPEIGGGQTAFQSTDRLSLADGAARIEPGVTEDVVILSWRGSRFTVSSRLLAPLSALAAGASVRCEDFYSAAAPEAATMFMRDMIGRGVFVLRSGA